MMKQEPFSLQAPSPEAIEILDLTAHSEARKELIEMARGPDEALDLARGCFLIALDELEDDPPKDDSCLLELDLLATHARHAFTAGASVPERLAALHQVFFEDADFQGCREDYYAIENVLVPRVLERRRGLPILLSVIYAEVARRCGVEALLVAFPGHFLVRCDLDDGFLVIDPFNGGRLLDRNDCVELLEEVTEGDHTFDEELLDSTSGVDVLTRVFLNLRRSHLLGKDLGRALRAQDGVVSLNPESIPALRDRARLYARLGAHRLAALDFEQCIALGPKSGRLFRALQDEAALARQKNRFLA